MKRAHALLVAAILIAPGTSALAACDPATNAKAVAEAREALNQLDLFTRAVKASGLPVPPSLTKAIGRFSRAADMGVDLAEAAGEADFAVQQIVSNKHALCDLSIADSDERFVCYAGIDRQWMARNLDATLNWDNTSSVIRRAAAKWLGSKCDRSEEPRPGAGADGKPHPGSPIDARAGVVPDKPDGESARGVRMDPKPAGSSGDLSGIRNDVLRLRKPGS